MFLIIGYPQLSPAQAPEEKTVPAPRIEVRISFPRTILKVGESVEVEVALENVGEQPVFVGRRLTGVRIDKAPYNFLFIVKDRKGQELGGLFSIIDCLPFKKENFTRADFFRAVMDGWIALRPGEVYFAKLDFPPGFREGALKPGRYLIRGRYSASGMAYLNQCNWLGLMKEELQGLPYEEFTGNVESNEVWITVRPE
jgi:hypothetical protein